MVVEVFKTNVNTRKYANRLIKQIHKTFTAYTANFDLDDCDKILRIQCTHEVIRSKALIIFLKDFGCHAEILSD
jgi:hypothetical protein